MVLSQKALGSFYSMHYVFNTSRHLSNHMCISRVKTSPKYNDTHEPKLLYSSGYQQCQQLTIRVGADKFVQ
jgi:hypothetical protein